jgi:nucleotide-binding universal stress UspA family protein
VARAVLGSGWTVRAVASGDSPAWGLVKRADEWSPDLLVVGAHAGTSAGRVLVLGSVTQKVVAHASCTVRVGRPRAASAATGVRVVVGFDGSPGARAAVEVVAARKWPAGSEVVLVAAADQQSRLAMLWSLGQQCEPSEEEERACLTRSLAEEADRLREAGVANVTPVVREGEARAALLAEAEARRADCIFVGARGLSRVERFLLGSVSGGVAARAQCSVEVVRPAGGK